MKFWKKNKLKKGNEVNVDKASEQQVETNLTVTNKIKIKVYRSLGGGGLGLAAKFQAEEKRDGQDNLFAINSEKKFKEDLDFTKDKIYTWINLDLKLQGKKRKDKIIEVEKAIKAQEELLDKINLNVDENAKYNYPDEEQKLNQYNIFLESIKRLENSGTYMVQEEGGIRTYYFESMDGLLYPKWWGATSNRVDTDLTVAKKIFAHENMVFNNEHNRWDKRFNIAAVIMLALGVIFLLVGAWLTYSHTEDMYSMAKDVNQGTITCTNTLALCSENYEKLSRQCNLGINSNENNIKNQNQNNNNVASQEMNNLIKKIN